jgi:hypothetical protein
VHERRTLDTESVITYNLGATRLQLEPRLLLKSRHFMEVSWRLTDETRLQKHRVVPAEIYDPVGENIQVKCVVIPAPYSLSTTP